MRASCIKAHFGARFPGNSTVSFLLEVREEVFFLNAAVKSNREEKISVSNKTFLHLELDVLQTLTFEMVCL
jgi:hypothetical protein